MRIAAGSVRETNAAILGDGKRRVPGNLPEETVGIGEVSGIATPKGLMSGLQDLRAGRFRLNENLVDLVASARIVCQCDAGEAVALGRNIGVFRKMRTRIQGQRHAACLKENDTLRSEERRVGQECR